MNTQKKYIVSAIVAIIVIGILVYRQHQYQNLPVSDGSLTSQSTSTSSTATSTSASASSTSSATNPGFAVVSVNGLNGYSDFGFSFNYPSSLKLSQSASPVQEVTGGFVATANGLNDTTSMATPSNTTDISSFSVIKAAGVSSAACIAAPVGNDWLKDLGKSTINANTFYKYEYGSKSGSRYFQTDEYVSEINGNCYKVSVSNVGTLPQSAAESSSITQSLSVLDTVINSFKAH